MPSTYTLNNGIELIGTGEQSGTWGDTTNTNFELLDTALDGQVSVTLAATGSSGSPNTLPISDGASSNGRNRLVIFGDGGDLGGTAFVQLTPNDSEKIIYVRNNLSGSRSILLFQGTYNASNDYEVPAGTTAVVFFNGAGTGAVAANVFNNAFFDSLRLGDVSVTAIIDDDTMGTAAATNIATSESIKAYVDAQVGANNELSEVLANGNTTGGTDISVSSGDDITFADNSKAIFGAGSDLQIYHDGTNSYIVNTTNDLIIGEDTRVRIKTPSLLVNNAADTENLLTATENGAVTLYYDNAAKLATTSTGVDITGTLTSDGLTVDGGATINEKLIINKQGEAFTLRSGGASTQNYVSIGRTGEDARITMAGAANNGVSSSAAGDLVVGVNNNLVVGRQGSPYLNINSSGVAINENGGANLDFRVESDGNTHMLFVDAGNDHVNIATSTDLGGVFNVDGQMSLSGVSGGTRRIGLLNETGAYTGTFALQAGGGSSGYGGGIVMYGHSHATKAGDVSVGISANSSGSFNVNTHGTDTGTDVFIVKSDGDIQLSTNTLIQSNSSGGSVTIKGGATNGGGTILLRGGNGDSDIIFKSQASTATPQEVARIGPSEMVVNEGSVDYDFRVESDSNTHMLFVDGGNNRVGINAGSTPSSIFHILNGDTVNSILQDTSANGEAYHSYINDVNQWRTGVFNDDTYRVYDLTNSESRIQIYAGAEMVINEGGADRDFRVESDANANALFVDAGNSRVGINGGSPECALQVYTGDINNTFLESSNATGTQVFIRNSTVASGVYTQLGFAPANNIFGGGIKVTSDEDFNSSDARTAHMELQTRHNGNIRTRLYLDENNTVFNEDGRDTDFRVESDSNTHMLFVDAGSNHVNIGGSIDYGSALNVFTTGTDALEIVSDNGNANAGPYLDITRKSGSPADGDFTGAIRFLANSDAAETLVGSINTRFDDVSNATEDSSMIFKVRGAGASTNALELTGGDSVFNQDGLDRDFRVESNSFSHALFVDAGADIVSIATSSDFGARFNVQNNDSARNCIRADNGVSSYTSYNVWSTFTSSGNNNTTAVHFAGYTQTGNKFVVYGNGNVANTNNSYGSLSDVRLKENIIDSGSQWDDIKALTVRKYSLKEDNLDAPNMLGVIAQEVEAAGMGGLVYETPDRDQDGEFTGTSTKQVNYSILYMKAVKALQEAMDRIETLEAKVTALENA